MDPQLTKDGKPYGPWRYKEIVKERYILSKHTHTSYKDLGSITPTERQYLIEFLSEDIKKQNEEMEKLKQKQQSRSS